MVEAKSVVQPPTRTGESKARQFILQWWAPVVQSTLSILLAVGVSCLENTRFAIDLGKGQGYSNIFPLRPGDVTTLVSASLLAIRLVGQSLVALVTWRCAMILLQNDGLKLSQLNTMIAYRLPSVCTGRHTWLIALVLLMMVPSGFITPLLSGSIDWKSRTEYEDTTSVRGGFGPDQTGLVPNDSWVAGTPDANFALAILMTAIGIASVTWVDETPYQNVSSVGKYRYIPTDPAPIHTEVKDVPIPVIEVHSISWRDTLEDWAVDLVLHQTKIIYTSKDSVRQQSFNIGNGILFHNKTTFPDSEGSTKIASTTRKIAVLAERYMEGIYDSRATNMSCDVLGGLKERWGDVSSYTFLPGPWGTCWVVGNINFTTGIRYFDTGRYIMNQTIEARRTGNDTENLVGDVWTEQAIYMLSDMMSTLPMMTATRRARARGDLTQYTEELVHQSYTAMRTAIYPYSPEQLELKTRCLVYYIYAKVDRMRVVAWLILNLLLPVSALLVSWIERHSQMRCMRNTLAETTLGPLLMDVREVLAAERNGITNLSYVTAADSRDMGILQLNVIEGPTGNSLFALTNAVRKSAATNGRRFRYTEVDDIDSDGT